MSFERTDAVALVKKVMTGVDVPSAFFFERKNPAAQQVVDWAERATGLKEQALRALLEAGGFTGDNAVPEGTALWRLAWVHRASSPNTSEQVVGAFLAGRFPEETARQTAAHRARGVQGAEAVGRRGRGTPLGTPRGSEAGAAAEDAVPEPARRPDGADDGAGKRGQSQDAEVVGEAAVRIHLLEKQMEALQAQGKQQTALLSRLVDKIDEKNERQAVAADPRESRALCDSDDDSEGTDKASSERTGTPFGFLPRGMASLDPEKWFALDDPGREFAALNVRDHYKDLTAAQRGSGLAPQAREARNRLDDLELIIRSLGRCSSLEDAEDVLQKLAERAVGRLQVLQRGVVQGDWESAEVLERALTVDDETPQTGWRQQEERGESPVVVRWAPLAYTALCCPDPPATGLEESGGPPKGRPRMVEKPLSKREVRQVRLDAEKHLSRALASSTWRGVESTHRRMLEFRGEWEAATGEKLSKAEATILWVSRKLRGSKEAPGISTSTALQYVQNVKSAEKRVGVPLDSQALRDFERSLKRQGALRPQKQALPATEEDVAKAIARERHTDTMLALALAWRGAARVADVTGLKAGDVTRQKDFLAINWSDTKSDPFKLGVTTGIVLPEHLDSILEKKLRRKAPQDRLLATSYRRMSAALKRVRKGLTGHSLRRGAAASLLDAGLSLEEIRRVTRHSSIEALVRYLPAGKIALAAETAAASRKL
ncbi:hypothetical protein DIPPA_31532 [Diplonema papillatum]|nr:hypothetical protein DIPPA_31532 [Diplonema papillatum]